ncbi:metal ABC transporter permease [Actinoplanes sp. GCM10030250]|uniref:metal ABC transporter permease n=1 Tax=Actinoplanes sp. GCM10030250 TaxID=3273376 RepID=UPI00360B3F83
MSWWDDALHRAIAEVVLAGALAGLVGVHVVLRRLSFFTMALTHATFPGVVLAALIGVDLLLGGMIAGTAVVLGVAALTRRPGQNATAATGVLLSAGFALGATLIATRSGFSRDLSSYLVGSILTVTTRDLITTAIVLTVVAGALHAGARPLLFTGFDPTGSRAAGLPTGAWTLLLLLLIEVVVVTLVPAVGTILAVALIVAPAAAARLWSTRLAVITPLAMALATASGVAGLYASARWNIAAGASIALAATGTLVLSALLTHLLTLVNPSLLGRAVTVLRGMAYEHRLHKRRRDRRTSVGSCTH